MSIHNMNRPKFFINKSFSLFKNRLAKIMIIADNSKQKMVIMMLFILNGQYKYLSE